ncbi:YciI family protein [Gottfriedia acidiceleris]|uniref:YciI family protein n=1 Tax=Gottfriedia acidiceleris TaxID=371036 RepID=UPI000B43A208|nr:YciI family protein [Gottfriedia acidiceleris]
MENFIYVLKPVRSTFLHDSTEEERNIVSDHFHYLEILNKEKTVSLAGRTEQAEFGIVILTTESLQHAEEIMQNDPAVKKNVMTAKLYPFLIALN